MRLAEFSLDGKVALVTGGSKGIGRAIALAFAEHGVDVAIAARGAEALERTRKEIEQRGRRALAVTADLERDEDIERLYQRVCDELSGIDVLVNNAGIAMGGGISRVTREEFDRIMAVNVWAPLRLGQLCYASMKKRGGGIVINIASVDGIRPSTGEGVYPLSKAALVNLSQIMAKEWARKGVRTMCVAPGLVRTDMAEPLIAYLEKEKLQLNPLGQVGEPEDIAAMVLLLASASGRFTNGGTFVVDGGELITGAAG